MRRCREMRFESCVVAALLASAAGCAHGPAAGDAAAALPILAATREELVRRVDADAAAVASVKGTLAVAFAERAGGDPRSCSAVLVARAPRPAEEAAGLYLKGYRALVPTLFTLVSDGRTFWLHVPRDNVVYTGPVASRGAAAVRGVRLEAGDLFRALFLQPLGGAEALEVAEEPSAYVVSARRAGRVARRLWIERRRFTVEREAYYDAEGREEVSIDRERFVDAGGHLYPERLRVRDAVTGASVTLRFEKLAVNPTDVRAEAFRPRTPAGARVVAVGGGGNAT
ncbi:MAG TPA: hypothetical protein VFL83_01165 [Anaeromyxobacter sp.]|nr:hypothetical protein [Anaeromyxobacter sp.]